MRIRKPKANFVDVEVEGVEARLVMDEHSNGANEYYQAFYSLSIGKILDKPKDLPMLEAVELIEEYIDLNYKELEGRFYEEE